MKKKKMNYSVFFNIITRALFYIIAFMVSLTVLPLSWSVVSGIYARRVGIAFSEFLINKIIYFKHYFCNNVYLLFSYIITSFCFYGMASSNLPLFLSTINLIVCCSLIILLIYTDILVKEKTMSGWQKFISVFTLCLLLCIICHLFINLWDISGSLLTNYLYTNGQGPGGNPGGVGGGPGPGPGPGGDPGNSNPEGGGGADPGPGVPGPGPGGDPGNSNQGGPSGNSNNGDSGVNPTDDNRNHENSNERESERDNDENAHTGLEEEENSEDRPYWERLEHTRWVRQQARNRDVVGHEIRLAERRRLYAAKKRGG